MEKQINPLTAVTGHDPYPYYAELVAQKPLQRHEAIGMWVSASAEAVRAVLQSEPCRVRPPDEPIPRHLLGSPVAAAFGQFIRMNDRSDRCPLKHAVATTFTTIDAQQTAKAAANAARLLTAGWKGAGSPEEITDFSFRLSAYTIAELLGVPANESPQIAIWLAAFVRCLAPGSDATQLAAGATATTKLLTALYTALTDAQAQGRMTLLTMLADNVTQPGHTDPEIIIANALGFLMQAYEATAGSIGNTLIALAADDALCSQARNDPNIIPTLIAEVLRHDSPVQNTRRFVAEDCVLAGQRLRAGDAILVVLAAANRDPAANPRPATFDLTRSARRSFTFGAGVHACPGAEIAALIAAAGVAQLLTRGVEPARLAEGHTYYPSANVRIPHFVTKHAAVSATSEQPQAKGQR